MSRNCAVCDMPGHHRWEADFQRYRCNICRFLDRKTPEKEFIEAVEYIGGTVPEDQFGHWFVYLAPLPAKRLKLPVRMVYVEMTDDQKRIIMDEYRLLTSI